MSYSIKVPYGILSMCKMDFKCPKCECPHTADDYEDSFNKGNRHFIYKKCKGCKAKIGITFDFMGDVRVWLREDEKNNK